MDYILKTTLLMTRKFDQGDFEMKLQRRKGIVHILNVTHQRSLVINIERTCSGRSDNLLGDNRQILAGNLPKEDLNLLWNLFPMPGLA